MGTIRRRRRKRKRRLGRGDLDFVVVVVVVVADAHVLLYTPICIPKLVSSNVSKPLYICCRCIKIMNLFVLYIFIMNECKFVSSNCPSEQTVLSLFYIILHSDKATTKQNHFTREIGTRRASSNIN